MAAGGGGWTNVGATGLVDVEATPPGAAHVELSVAAAFKPTRLEPWTAPAAVASTGCGAATTAATLATVAAPKALIAVTVDGRQLPPKP